MKSIVEKKFGKFKIEVNLAEWSLGASIDIDFDPGPGGQRYSPKPSLFKFGIILTIGPFAAAFGSYYV